MGEYFRNCSFIHFRSSIFTSVAKTEEKSKDRQKKRAYFKSILVLLTKIIKKMSEELWSKSFFRTILFGENNKTKKKSLLSLKFFFFFLLYRNLKQRLLSSGFKIQAGWEPDGFFDRQHRNLKPFAITISLALTVLLIQLFPPQHKFSKLFNLYHSRNFDCKFRLFALISRRCMNTHNLKQ